MRDFRENQLGIPPAFDAQQWLNPQEGFLLGKIQEREDTLLILNTRDNTLWQVGISNADIAPMVKLNIGEDIRALGEQTGDSSFEAETIMPGKPMRVMHMMLFQKINLPNNSSERNPKLPAYQMMQAR
jgi:hypothetical protein